MSFVPNPTQANASNNNARVNTSGAAAAAAPTPEETETDTVFKVRTFDVYWVEKHALMYRDGTTTVSLIYTSIDGEKEGLQGGDTCVCACAPPKMTIR